MAAADTSLYESESLRGVTGLCIRPGGFLLTERAVSYCGFRAGDRLVDVGCGAGATAAYLRDAYRFAVAGIDASSALLAEGLQCDPTLCLVRGRAEELPFPGGAVGGVLCECVLSLVSAPMRALKEFRRVLCSGGRLILTDIYARRPEGVPALRNLSLNSCFRGAVAAGEVKSQVNESGFTILLFEDHSSLLREMAARLVLAHGSLENFWGRACGDGDCRSTMAAIADARPGYYLLIAQKTG
jgi:arsenite methyltransferase